MGTMANVTRADIDEAIKRLQELRETIPEGGEAMEIPTGESPAAPAIREAVGSLLGRLGRFLTSNQEPRK